MASAMDRSSTGSNPGTSATHFASPSSVSAETSARVTPRIVTERARSLRRVPAQSSQGPTLRYLSTRLMPFSSLTLESAFSTVRTAL